MLQSDADAAYDEALLPTSPCWLCLHTRPFPQHPLWPCKSASGAKEVLTQTSVVWERGAGPAQELCARSVCARHGDTCHSCHTSGAAALRLHSFAPKLLIPPAHCLRIAKYTVPSPASSLCFSNIPHTCLFASFLRNVNKFQACFYKMSVTNCHRAEERAGFFLCGRFGSGSTSSPSPAPAVTPGGRWPSTALLRRGEERKKDISPFPHSRTCAAVPREGLGQGGEDATLSSSLRRAAEAKPAHGSAAGTARRLQLCFKQLQAAQRQAPYFL